MKDSTSDNIPEAVWDEARTIQRMGDNKELIQKIATLFLRDAPAQMQQALIAIKQQDYDTSHLAIHSLKGTSSNFCTTHFEASCSDLLVALKHYDWSLAHQIYTRLNSEYLIFAAQLEEFLTS